MKRYTRACKMRVAGRCKKALTVIKTDTNRVPAVNDFTITHYNSERAEQRCKMLKSCVLYVDMRNSTDISNELQRKTLVKLYGVFIEEMVRCVEKYGGKVRGIVGDCVMAVFDSKNCFSNAMNTAILMNSVCSYVINKHFKNSEIQLGIGIDHGEMLIAKAGTVKQGVENFHYKSLVWLGNAANFASKLTDIAGKDDYPPIMVSKSVYNGYKKDCPNCNSFKKDLWNKKMFKDTEVYGVNLIFTDVRESV